MSLPCILFVDDDERVLRSLQSVFRRRYRVLTATRAKNALNILHTESVNVVVSDQKMPEMTGDLLLKQIAEEHPDVVRILLTGYADFSVTIDAVNRGDIYCFIAKPWDYDEIKSTMADAVAFSLKPIEQQREEQYKEVEVTTSETAKNNVVEEAEKQALDTTQSADQRSQTLPEVEESPLLVLPTLLIEYSQSIRNSMRLKCRRLQNTLYSVNSQRHIPGMLRIRPDISLLLIGLENKAEAITIIQSVKSINPHIVVIGLTEEPSIADSLLEDGLIFAVSSPSDSDEIYLETMLVASERYRQSLLASVQPGQKKSRGGSVKSVGLKKIRRILQNK